jgi:hypothetical protein
MFQNASAQSFYKWDEVPNTVPEPQKERGIPA